MSPSINTTPPMGKPTVKLHTKQKQEQSKRRTIKHAKWDDKEESKSVWFSKSQKLAGSRKSVSLARGVSRSLQW